MSDNQMETQSLFGQIQYKLFFFFFFNNLVENILHAKHNCFLNLTV